MRALLVSLVVGMAGFVAIPPFGVGRETSCDKEPPWKSWPRAGTVDRGPGLRRREQEPGTEEQGELRVHPPATAASTPDSTSAACAAARRASGTR